METKPKLTAAAWFIIIVIVISYLLAGAYYLAFPERDKISYTIMGVIYMYMPFLSALIVDKLILKRKSLKSWAINFRPNWWYLAAWPAVIAVAFVVLGANILWPNVQFAADMSGFWERMTEQFTPEQIEAQKHRMENLPAPLLLIMVGQALIAGLTINALAAFGEETGWRAFLVREYKNLKFWNAALRIGILWGLWHAPLILMGHNYPEHNLIGVGMMTIWCILLSPLFLYIRLKTHSVIGAAIMHGTLNASAGIPLIYLAGGSDLTVGFTGFAGFFVLALIIGLMTFFDLKSKKPITNRTLLEASKQE